MRYRSDINDIITLLQGGMDPTQGLNMYMGAQAEQEQRQAERQAMNAQMITNAGQLAMSGLTPDQIDLQTQTLLNAQGIHPLSGRYEKVIEGIAPAMEMSAQQSQLLDEEDIGAIAGSVTDLAGQGFGRSEIRKMLQHQYETMYNAAGIPYDQFVRDGVNATIDAAYGGPSSYFDSTGQGGEGPVDPNEDPVSAMGGDMQLDTFLPDIADTLLNDVVTFGGAGKLQNAENIGDVFEGIGQTALGLGSFLVPFSKVGAAAKVGTTALQGAGLGTRIGARLPGAALAGKLPFGMGARLAEASPAIRAATEMQNVSGTMARAMSGVPGLGKVGQGLNSLAGAVPGGTRALQAMPTVRGAAIGGYQGQGFAEAADMNPLLGALGGAVLGGGLGLRNNMGYTRGLNSLPAGAKPIGPPVVTPPATGPGPGNPYGYVNQGLPPDIFF